MKLLFENWRKYITEVDTDDDGTLSPDELRAMADELEPEEEPESNASKLWTLFLVGENPSSYVKFAHDAGEDKIAADLESFFNQVNNVVTLYEQYPREEQKMLETTKEIIDALYNLSNFGGEYEKKWNVSLKYGAGEEFKEALVRLISSCERLKRDLEADWYSGSRGGWRRIDRAKIFVMRSIEWFYEFVGKTPSWTKEK